MMHDPEQPVSEAGDDGEVATDLGDGAADGPTANLTLEILQCGHDEFGIVRAGRQRRTWPGFWAWLAGPLVARPEGPLTRAVVPLRGCGGFTMSMSRPVAARATRTCCSAVARRMPPV